MDTYVARARGVPSSAGNAVLAIYNNVGSGKVIDISGIRLDSPAQSHASGLLPGICEIRRITSLSGGSSLTPTKMDSSNQAIPSGVIVRENGVPTLSSDNMMSQLCLIPNFKANDAASMFTRQGMGIRYMGMDRSVIYETSPSSSVSPICLRQGEGIALYISSPPVTYTMRYSILFKIAGASNETYIVDEECAMLYAGQSPVAIFNNDATAVIEIYSIELREAGDYTLPIFIGMPIGGISGSITETITASKMDSASPNVPEKIEIMKDCIVIASGTEKGAVSNIFSTFHSRGLFGSNLLMNNTLQMGGPSYFAAMYSCGPTLNMQFASMGVKSTEMIPTGSSIRLYPGYGFALVQAQEDSQLAATPITPQYNSSLAAPEARVIFSISDMLVPGSAQ